MMLSVRPRPASSACRFAASKPRSAKTSPVCGRRSGATVTSCTLAGVSFQVLTGVDGDVGFVAKAESTALVVGAEPRIWIGRAHLVFIHARPPRGAGDQGGVNQRPLPDRYASAIQLPGQFGKQPLNETVQKAFAEPPNR